MQTPWFISVIALFSYGCALQTSLSSRSAARVTSTRSSGTEPRAHTATGEHDAMDHALIALRDRARRGDAEVLHAWSIELGRGGATEINGDRAEDERVVSADITVSDGSVALIVLQTSCGNVRIVGLVREGERWIARQSQPLVPHAIVGRCVRSRVRAQPVALRADPARDAAIGVRWQDALGDEVHGPYLWVIGLDAQHGFSMLLERAPFGGTDDRTGATTVGSVAVIDELPAPRPLFVELRPGTRGLVQTSPNQRIVRRYELRGARMELVDEQRSTLDEQPPPQ